jgi:L-fuconolactonase
MTVEIAATPRRVDAHQHFWRYAPDDYGWIGEGMDVLKRDYLPEDLSLVLKRRRMDGSIVVQARADASENAFLIGVEITRCSFNNHD